MSDNIEQLYVNFVDSLSAINLQQNPTLYSISQEHYAKSFLVSAASKFEMKICRLVREFAHLRSNGNAQIKSFIEANGIARQYHTYFKWDDPRNANSFFKLFGDEFSDQAKSIVKSDAELESSVKAFLLLGQLRNRLVHKNYLDFSLDKTMKELHDDYQKAKYFVEWLEVILLRPHDGD